MKLLFLILIVTSCQAQQQEKTNQECDNPDAPVSCSFEGMPVKLSAKAVITGDSGRGEPMEITGLVTRNGKPVPGVIIYAYHTDDKGIYSKNGKETGAQKWHGQYHGWCKTDENGQYTIISIRPAKYPNSQGPAHIHAALKLPGGESFWITDFVFKDDPAVVAGYRPPDIPGGTGIVDLQRDNAGTWRGTRTITL